MIKMQLHENALFFAKKITEKVEIYRGKVDLLKRLFNGKLLKQFLEIISEFDKIEDRPMQSIYELQFALFTLKNEIRKTLDPDFACEIEFTEDQLKSFEDVSELIDGTNFTKKLKKLKLNALIETGDS